MGMLVTLISEGLDIDFIFICLSQDVQPNSPADLASLRSNTDYIIGADSVLHEVRFAIEGVKQ